MRPCGDVNPTVSVVRKTDAEFVVDGSLVLGVSVGERADDVLELPHQGFDLVFRVLARGRLATQDAFDAPTFSFNLGNPGRGTGDLAVHLEQLSIASELGIALLEAPSQVELASVVIQGIEVAHGRERFAGDVEAIVGEETADPLVKARNDRVFLDVDGLGVLLFGDRVLRRELSPVVRTSIVPRRLHLATTLRAAHQS